VVQLVTFVVVTFVMLMVVGLWGKVVGVMRIERIVGVVVFG
jgi:hypothetical protein